MITLDERLEAVQEELENIDIQDTPYNLYDYVHGRCHIFAQALLEELGYEMEFLWDDDYWFEGANHPTIVLVHAYCILPKGQPFKGKYVDARGGVSKRIIEHEFECNSHVYEKFSMDRLNVAYKNEVLEKPTETEIKAIRKYIRDNINIYQ